MYINNQCYYNYLICSIQNKFIKLLYSTYNYILNEKNVLYMDLKVSKCESPAGIY